MLRATDTWASFSLERISSEMNKYQSLARNLAENSQKWLVTGAAGFIGSNIAIRLLELNQNVIGIDNFSTGTKSNIKDIEQAAKKNNQWNFIETDITDQKSLKKSLSGVDYVIHHAALGSVPQSLTDPISANKNNVDGFVKVLWESKQAQVKKLIYASSSSVYGSDQNLPKKENSIGHALSPYAATKRIDEIYAETFLHCYQLPIVGLRYFNVFGPRQSPDGPYAAVIPIWIDAMKNQKEVFINGDGSYTRDFCYIENVVQANILAALSDDKCNGKVFNIAYEQSTSLLELYQYLKSEVQKVNPKLNIEKPHHREFRVGDIPHSLADVGLAKSHLGYHPEVDVKGGIKKTVEYFLK